MRVEKDAFKFLAGLATVAAVFLVLNFWPGALAAALLLAAVALFMRETIREANFSDGQIVSPASGKIIAIEEVLEPEFLREKTRKISIFMSLLDEHVNYAPITGTVAYLRHKRGGFKKAYLEEASAQNECQYIGFQRGDSSLLMKQIAGVVARRIICRCRLQDNLRAGEKLGLIRFGSRVELFLPLRMKIRVKEGDRVKGASTIIGSIA